MTAPMPADPGVWLSTPDDAEASVHYHFPVTIEVRGAAAPVDVDAAVERAVSRLILGLEGS